MSRNADLTQLRGEGLNKYNQFESPAKRSNYELGNIDRMQSKIQSMLNEKAMRF